MLTVPDKGDDRAVAAAIDVDIVTGVKAGAAAIGRVFGAIVVGFVDAAVVDVTALFVIPNVPAATGLPKEPDADAVDTVAASGSGLRALQAA